MEYIFLFGCLYICLFAPLWISLIDNDNDKEKKEKIKMKQINNQEFKNIRNTSRMTQREFATFFKIPYWTIVNWENEKSQCPEYVIELLKFCLTNHYRFEYLHCENCKNDFKCNKIGVEFKCQNRQIML